MNYRISYPALTALMLAIAAGAAAPVSAQSSDRPTQPMASIASTVDFRSADWLSDRKVVNNNGEEIATVSDLILDRGSGRIEYLVVKTGTILGMGGRAVAIPYSAFAWDAAGKDRFVLAATEEQLKLFPQYTPESWKSLQEVTEDDTDLLRKELAAQTAATGDPYTGALDGASQAKVSGEITSVERVRTSNFGEQIVITVKTTDGSSQRVALGPSWYINSGPAAPMRGDKVVVETLALPRDPDRLLVGTELQTANRKLTLRGRDGAPAWALNSVQVEGRNYGTPYSRFLPLSTLDGMKVDCRGNETGRVYDVILDRNSGEIGFLSIDPNRNFLGIGDTKRMIPWSVATVTVDDVVRIDASKEMVLASPETPSDLATLNSGDHAARVYKAFNVPAPRFENRKAISSITPPANDAWSARGPILSAIEPGSSTMFQGKVIDVTDVRFEKGIQSARAVKIETTGEHTGQELVLVGPTWYMDHQRSMYKAGDMIKIEASRTQINGKTYWIAKSVECNEMRHVMLDGHGAPAWARR